MHALLDASLTFPAVIYSGVLALALIYWLFVVIGALDMDLLGGADGGVEGIELDGVVKGSIEGAAKGALEGVAKGALDGAAESAAEGLADGVDGVDAADAAEGGGLATLMASLQLNRAPATVVLTLLATFGWLGSVLSLLHVAPLWTGAALPGWLFKALVLLISFVIALPLTSLVVRPLGAFFVTREAQSRKDLIGKVAVVSTGRVDERFGQAHLQDGGAGLILDVRCDTPGLVKQGDKVILVSWDEDRDAFVVEPMDDVLIERRIQRISKEDPAASPSDGDPGAAASVEADPAQRRNAR